MTLDAMHWVWNHSQSKGNSRLALLAVADRAKTSACEVRLSYSDLMRALNVTNRTVVRDAIKTAVESGELEVVVPGKGTRAALYRLPKAVGYVRSDPRSGTESAPPESKKAPRSGTESAPQAADLDRASGTDSAPEQYGFRTASGTESVPHYQTRDTRKEGASEGPATEADPIPSFARPLVDACTLANVNVRWNLSNSDWFVLDALIKRSGITALADFARKQAAAKDITYARYFLPGWRELAPLPNAGAERPQLRAVPGGWQPYRNPTDHSVYESGF